MHDFLRSASPILHLVSSTDDAWPCVSLKISILEKKFHFPAPPVFPIYLPFFLPSSVFDFERAGWQYAQDTHKKNPLPDSFYARHPVYLIYSSVHFCFVTLVLSAISWRALPYALHCSSALMFLRLCCFLPFDCWRLHAREWFQSNWTPLGGGGSHRCYCKG